MNCKDETNATTVVLTSTFNDMVNKCVEYDTLVLFDKVLLERCKSTHGAEHKRVYAKWFRIHYTLSLLKSNVKEHTV